MGDFSGFLEHDPDPMHTNNPNHCRENGEVDRGPTRLDRHSVVVSKSHSDNYEGNHEEHLKGDLHLEEHFMVLKEVC